MNPARLCILASMILSLNPSLYAVRPLATYQSAVVLSELRSELRSHEESFETKLRRARKELSNYVRVLNTTKLRNPEQGEQLWDRLFELRLFVNSWADIPNDSVGYSRFRELKDAVIKTLMDTAREILDLDQFGSYDYQGWEILASARRYVVKLRAIPLKEQTSRQLLEDQMEGLEDAADFISGVDADKYQEEINFVWGQIQSTAQNVTARIVELEQARSEIRKMA